MRTDQRFQVLIVACDSQTAATPRAACWRLIAALALLAGVLAFPVASADADPGTTELVSVDSAGDQGNSSSFEPSISAKGRFVAFQSSASNLVPGDINGLDDVFVHDRQTGATELVSVDRRRDPGEQR